MTSIEAPRSKNRFRVLGLYEIKIRWQFKKISRPSEIATKENESIWFGTGVPTVLNVEVGQYLAPYMSWGYKFSQLGQ